MRPQSLNATLDGDRGFDGLIVQPQNQWQFAPNVSYPLVAATRWAERVQQMDRVAIASLAVEETRRQVAITVASAYLAVVGFTRQVEVQQRALDTSRAQRDFTEKRLAAGAGSRLNALRAAQLVAMDESMLELAQLAVRRAQEALGVAMNAPGPIDALGEPAFEVPRDVEPLLAIRTRTDYRLGVAQRDLSARIVRDSSRDWWPTATVSFDPQYIAPAGLFQPSGTWRFTLALSQPIYDGGLRRARLRQREADVKQNDVALQQVEVRAQAEVRTAQAAVAFQERALDRARVAAQHAREVLQITVVAFEAGASTNIEVIEAQRAARDLDSAVAVAEDRVRQARLDLLVALGRFPV